MDLVSPNGTGISRINGNTLSAVRMGDEIRDCGTYPNGRFWRIETVTYNQLPLKMRRLGTKWKFCFPGPA